MQYNRFHRSVVAGLLACIALAGCTKSSNNVVPNNGNGAPFYVVNSGNGTIVAFNSNASGTVNPAPVNTISSASFATPEFIARDPSGNIYVTNAATATSTITVFAAGANGSVVPTQTISGSNTLLNQPSGIALDSKLNIWVANYGSNQILEFAAGATGNVAPINTISGTNTQLNKPDGLYIDGSNNVYVSVATAQTAPQVVGAVLVFSAGAGSMGNATPAQAITGTNTLLNGPAGIALDASGNLYVANSATPSITEYAPGATGNVAPIAVLQGTSTGLSTPVGVWYSNVSGISGLYVVNLLNDSVTFYASGQSFNGNITPNSTYIGSNTTMSSPEGISF